MKVQLYISVLILLLLNGLLSLSCKKRPDNSDVKQITLDSSVTVSPAQMVMSNQSTIKVGHRMAKGVIFVLGFVMPNPERTVNIAAKFSGRIEKLYINYNYQYVKRGTKIMEVYSADLNAYQSEYLYLMKSVDDKVLLASSREKLRLLGMTDKQLDLLEKNQIRTSSLSIITPVDGYLLFEKETSPSLSTKNTQEMPADNMPGPDRSKVQTRVMSSAIKRIREGDYISEGQTLFSVNDLKEVWGVFSISTEYIPFLKTGTALSITSDLYPDETIQGSVNFIEPIVASGQKYITIRVILPNSRVSLKANTLLKARFILAGTAKIQVPSSSIYDLGTRKIVWIYTGKTNGPNKVFKAREVTTGITVNGYTEIIKGLQSSEEIAKDAGLLIDSEGFLQPD